MSSSQDYHAYISEVHRTPTILTDVPQYPNVQQAFNKKQVVYKEEEEVQPHHHHHLHLLHRHDNPETRKKVEVIEYEQTAKVDNGTGQVVYEEDVEVDQYNRRKDKGGFQLHKWKTFNYQGE